MQVPVDQIEELRRLYRDAYNIEISVEEATEMARRLIVLYEFLAKKLPNDQLSGSEPATVDQKAHRLPSEGQA